MTYTTRLFGAPHGIDGERGEDTTAPARLARETLTPGQSMECFAPSDEDQKTPLRRYVCGEDGKVYRVEM